MSISSGLTGFAVSRWGDDPWALGSWSLIGRHGTPRDRIGLGTPVSTRLRIAGEATHPTRAGMTHGAYEQGADAGAWAAGLGHRRVAVVGAGMAGLAAARVLVARGVEAVVFEARDRIGGRTAGVDVGGTGFDLGANWLQQYDDNVLARLAEQCGLTVVATDFTDPLVLGSAVSTTKTDAAGLEDELRSRLAAAPADASIQDVLDDWLRSPAPWAPDVIRRFVDAEIVMDTGAPLSWLSARHGFEPGVGEGDRWIVGGYRLLTDHLAEGLDIRLSHPVYRIEIDRQVTVNGEDSYDAVIVTVPVPVLAAGTILFDPPLPAAHRTALDHLGAGRVEKVILRFDRRFWPVHGYYRVHGPEPTSVSEWLDATPADGIPTLVGLFAGPWLAGLWTGTDSAVARGAAAVFRAASAGHDCGW
ncbi:flavin monoamine oxidase family protein [Actinoplanes rectilineatus]|uniref:flavin monoamine oxidase family protein n=1 Tax=Actinoplanes rectilineatus TaxID=113571 RepID=UPI0005F2E9D3|nr:NAD(P)/FAD-dependent oxidoreductase [Actinoplanes rectilineatus]